MTFPHLEEEKSALSGHVILMAMGLCLFQALMFLEMEGG
jgi:hypothetical protein